MRRRSEYDSRLDVRNFRRTNLKKDLGERIDLADENTEKTSELLSELEEFEKLLKQEGSYWDVIQ